MIVIAKTHGGVLIQADVKEVEEILRSVNGVAPKEIDIGQKIPAIDYAASITKLKKLKEEYAFKNLISSTGSFMREVSALEKAVSQVSEVEL
jgi:copper chaperone CopZ